MTDEELLKVYNDAFRKPRKLSHRSALRAVYERGVADATRWIPVGERLPNYADRVHKGDTISDLLLVTNGSARQIAFYHFPTNSWNLEDNLWPELPITHWMPLPAPPQCAAPLVTDAKERSDG